MHYKQYMGINESWLNGSTNVMVSLNKSGLADFITRLLLSFVYLLSSWHSGIFPIPACRVCLKIHARAMISNADF